VFVYTGSVVTGVNYQTVDTGTATTRVDVVYAYDGSSNPTSVTISSTTRHTMAYSSGYLTTVSTPGPVGGSPVQELALGYLSSTPGTVVRSTTALGDLGFEYGSTRGTCSGGSLVYFNRIGTTTCDADSDCGSDHLCGGETNFAASKTGVCYRAARCLQLTTPDEHLIDTVAPLPATACTGACAETTEYDWGSTPDLAGIEQADGTWTSFQRNSDGLVTLSARGDTDSDPTNAGGQKTWTFYGNSSFPGRVTEVRRVSELKAGGSYSCDASTTTDCARTLYTWNSDGLLGSRQDLGFTLDASGATVSYSYTTAYTYDSKGRMTQLDGPLSGSNDVTDYTYWTSSDVFKNDYRKEIKRKKDATNYLVTTLDAYDNRGNAASQQDPDGTFTCSTFSSFAALVTTQRVAMAGQTSCTTSDGSDLTTTYTYDEWFRLTKTQRPLGNCEHREYDSKGRLSKVKERDDCTTSSAGENIEYSYLDVTTATDQLMSIVYKDAGGSVQREYWFTYHDGMQLATDINPVDKSKNRSYTYNADGLLAQVDHENSLGKTTWTYDALDREDTVDLFKTVSTSDEWDSSYAAQLGRPIEVEDDDGKSLETISDDLGRKVKTVSPDSGTTLFVFDAASRMVTKVEADGLAGEVSHSFTYDNLDRRLTEDYGSENCGAGQPVEVEYVYDAPPVSCPGGASCALASGRLAYVKSTLLCSASYGDNALNQEVFYGYDAAGRTINEWIQDDSSRTAEQTYSWDKNGNAIYWTAPSGSMNYTEWGSTGENSDTDELETLSDGYVYIADRFERYPFGPVYYYRHRNEKPSSNKLETAFVFNKAYRPSLVYLQNGTPVQYSKLDYSEDAKGRTTFRNYDLAYSTTIDSHYTYDWLDRVVCDAAVSGACPTTSPNLRNNLNGSPPYTASNDRTQLLHYNSGYGTYTYSYTLKAGKDQIGYFTTSPSTGTTNFGWDDRGNRTSDDSTSYSHDARSYSYEGRKLVRQITGKKKISSTWYTYTLTNAYDHKGRRVFKSYVINGVESQYFYYYNLRDQLIEVKHTPNISSSSTYSLFDFFWSGDRPIAYYQVDYPSVTTTRRYFHSDADNRVYELWTWPTSGESTRVWALQPDAFGWDQVLTGSSIYQPLRGADSMNQYDVDLTAWNDSATSLRPPLVLTPSGYYDPLSATVLQADPSSGIVASYLDPQYPIGSSAHSTSLSLPAQPILCKGVKLWCDALVWTRSTGFLEGNVRCEQECVTFSWQCLLDGYRIPMPSTPADSEHRTTCPGFHGTCPIPGQEDEDPVPPPAIAVCEERKDPTNAPLPDPPDYTPDVYDSVLPDVFWVP